MEDSSEVEVYHGSKALFDTAFPKQNRRARRRKTGEVEVVFEGMSFHATPYKWIALAYTYNREAVTISGKEYIYTMGVDLYTHNKELDIFGVGSLEVSLEKLYGKGGYVYHFSKDQFIHTEGLGNLEVIIQEEMKPSKIERIDDPVKELKEYGVTFKFIDLSLPENEKDRLMFVE